MLIIKNTVLTKLLYIAFVFVNGVSEIYSADSNASSSSTALVHRQPTSIIPYGQTPTDIGPYDPILAQGIRISFPPMPFQIGFEFQEISSLCPWAKDLKGIDKKKLFSFHLGRDPKPLWHVEIDDTDIEFVTPPFKPHEKNKLNLAISTIQVAIKVLQRELNTKSKITFDQWTREILFELNLTDSEISQTQTYTDIAQREIIKPKPINFPHVDPEKITKTELVVREEVSYWKPIFAPQVTIQHPLEDTIPLYFSLFGFKSPYMISFVSNLPFLDFYQSKLQFADQNIMNKFIQMFRQKIHGLIFLHALTLSAMTPDVREELSSAQTDQIQLQETQYAWQNFRQVDPKVRLTLMSRRPFSDMYANLKQVNYAEHFIKVMSLNPEFTTFYKVPNHFRYTNYAEQFFNTKGAPLSGLWEFIQPLFEQKFLQNNYLVLQELLSQGILSTTMVRNFSNKIIYKFDKIQIPLNQLFKDYFLISLHSVETPLSNFVFDPIKLAIRMVKSKYDSLSPPWILHPDNAMGYYKDVLPKTIKTYGEAIVEVRAIANVQPWFLQRAGLPLTLTGSFLKYPSDDMVSQALGLFDFLANFRSEKNMIEIFYLGIPYAVKNH